MLPILLTRRAALKAAAAAAASVAVPPSPITLMPLFPHTLPAGNQWSVDIGEASGTRIIKVARRTAGSTITLLPDDGRLAVSDDGTNAYFVAGQAAARTGQVDYTVTETHPRAANNGAITNALKMNFTARSNAATVRDQGYKNASLNGQVHNASQSPWASPSSTGGRDAFCGVKPFKLARVAYESLRFGFSMWRISATANLAEVICPNDLTIPAGCMSAYVEGAPARVVPLTFGGSEEVTFTSGVDLFFCDALMPSQFGLTEFEPSTDIRFKIDIDVPEGCTVYGCGATDLGMQSLWYASANRPAGFRKQVGEAGYFSGLPKGRQPLASGFFPTILVGIPKEGAAHPAPMLGILDSIGDRLSDGGAVGTGYFRRAGRKAGVPFFAHSLGGRQIAHWIENNYRSRKLLWFHEVLVDGVGTNDIGPAGAPLAKIVADHAELRAQAAAAGISKFVKVNVVPRIDTGAPPDASGRHTRTAFRATDLVHQFPYFTGAKDAAGMATGLGFEAGGTRDRLNAAMAAMVGRPNGYDCLLDLSGIASDPGDSSKWKVDPFSARLTSASEPGAMTLSMDSAPTVGQTLVLGAGTPDIDPIDDPVNGGKNYGFTVRAVSGSGPFAVTVAEANAVPGMLQLGQSPYLPHTAGTLVRASNSPDETHPGAPIHAAGGDALAAWLHTLLPA